MRSKLAERLSAPGLRFKALPWAPSWPCSSWSSLSLAAILAPLIAPHDPLETGDPATAPSAEHLFGTDRIGRDVLSRLMYGAQASLMIGLGAVALAIVVGGPAGLPRRNVSARPSTKSSCASWTS